jgi:phosphoadenosine phosphosulfate reductase
MYFKNHFTVKVTYRKKTYELECHVEHMLIGKKEPTWLYFCDEYGRTGTSQCFGALRFKMEGDKRYDMLTTDGMKVTAISPKEVCTEVQTFEVVDADNLTKKEEQAVRLLQSAGNGYDQPIEVGYSGGKDSDIILHLSRRAGINIRPIYKNTTIDPPGTIAHVKEQGAEVMRPEKSFFKLMEEMGMPNRFQRYCCRFLKEYKVLDRSIMGVRKAESTKRAEQYEEPTECRVYGRGRKKETAEAFYPILDWSDEDVLNYIARHGIKLHPLYYSEDGTIDPKRRLGCMCCPLAYYKKRLDYFRRYPGMVRAYIRAAQKFLDTHPDTDTAGKYSDVYEWFTREAFLRSRTNGKTTRRLHNLPPPQLSGVSGEVFRH